MSSASVLDPDEAAKTGGPVVRPTPLSSVTASAARITSEAVKGGYSSRKQAASWQEDAWEMYDLVGEQRFLASTLAGRMSQATLYVGQVQEGQIDDPDPVEDERLAAILESISALGSDISQMLDRIGKNLFMPGECWIVGIPRDLMPSHRKTKEDDPNDPDHLVITTGQGSTDLLETIEEATMDQLEWRAMSTDEVSFDISGTVTLRLSDGDGGKVETSPDSIFLIRVWRPHPRKHWEADSPTRSSLPVLRELVGLTMHISAQIDSRLAGAGLLLVPESASRAMKQAEGLPEDSKADPFGQALMEAMITPISDRGSASAVVPLTATVPDESAEKFRLIEFSQPLDAEARNLREEAIRRLALGQDAPPELLLGMAGMNHWGAWLVREDVVTTHLEPPLALICDALTTQYLRPMMEALNYPDDVIRKTVVWYDVSKLIVRPDRANDAGKLFDRGALSAKALRDANGFDESDAPEQEEQMDPASQVVLDMLKAAPSLATDPGISALHDAVSAMLEGKNVENQPEDSGDGQGEAPSTDTPADESTPANGLPDTADDAPLMASGLDRLALAGSQGGSR